MTCVGDHDFFSGSCAPPVAAVTSHRFSPLCADHLDKDHASVPLLDIEDLALVLQARLELRYGVEVVVKTGEQQWT